MGVEFALNRLQLH